MSESKTTIEKDFNIKLYGGWKFTKNTKFWSEIGNSQKPKVLSRVEKWRKILIVVKN